MTAKLQNFIQTRIRHQSSIRKPDSGTSIGGLICQGKRLKKLTGTGEPDGSPEATYGFITNCYAAFLTNPIARASRQGQRRQCRP